ncbi:MAG: hypothetical protein DI622_11425 [Chryseobacterium sp.]|nr:MAG: hypothetical protein DI622_11425 [Chryseobacterium sp.]
MCLHVNKKFFAKARVNFYKFIKNYLMNTTNVTVESVNLILQKLQELQVTYNQNKALILTEDDLKCQLFRLIYDLFPRNSETFNPEITGCSVHSEIKFFDELGKLTLRPDLIVIDPGNISIFHSTEYTMKRSGPEYNQLSSKNFTIAGGAILIELKFCRNRSGINQTDIIDYQSDIDKMQRLKSIIESNSYEQEKVYGIFAAFNKTNNGEAIFEDFKSRNSDKEDLHIFYGSGNVDFSTNSRRPYDFIDEEL